MDNSATWVGTQQAEQGVARLSGEVRRAAGSQVGPTGRKIQSVDPGDVLASSRSAQELGYCGGQVRRRRGGQVLVAAAGELRDSLPGRPIGVGPEVDDIDRDRLGGVDALLDEF